MTRRRRGTPASRAAVELGDRDVLLLEAVGVSGFLSTSQLAREFFPSADRCRRRVRQLLDAKYISVTLFGSSRNASLVSLAQGGVHALSDLRGPIEGVRMAGPIRATSVAHALLVADARLFCWNLPNARLVGWHGGRSRKADELGLGAHHLAPDAIGELRTNRDRVLFIEADCGTEGVALDEKVQKYSRVLGLDPNRELWICAKGDATRIRAVQRMCKRARIGQWVRVLTEEFLNRRPCPGPPPVLARLAEFEAL